MKKFVTPILVLVLLTGGVYAYTKFGPQPNPDPNHTHADFAVWMQDQRVNFASEQLMSGTSTDPSSHPEEGPRKYLHLHDGNGNVVHRHKPGLTLGDFFASLGMEFTRECFRLDIDHASCTDGIDGKFRMFVNGTEVPVNPDYVFEDLDQILLTFDTDPSTIPAKLKALTAEACRYSQTCPWKGTPPVENCISDPTVPCIE